ncbi:MAG: clan AA aspartic protease (TIGR02281 family) [Paraglaciecola sp.]|jgi:clan AA aspartic protease (TIGR02281 family)
MNKWIGLLLLLLSVSVALNFYLFAFYELSTTPNQNIFAQSKNINGKIKQNSSSQALVNWTLNDQTTQEVKPSPPTQHSERLSGDAQLHQPVTNRVELLAQATLWLKNKNLLTLGAFLQDYLKRYPQDMDFLLLEAKVKVETTLLSDAITHYYDLLRKPMTATQQREIERQIEQLSKNTIEQLKQNDSWNILAMFVEPLLQLEPNSRLYIVSLAMAYAELFQESLMENVLASLDFDDPDAQNIRKIIVAQQITPANNEFDKLDADDKTDEREKNTDLGRSIPLKKFGDQYVVEAKLSNNQVALLIDTGASVTAISKQYFDTIDNRYKNNFLGRFSIGTAGGSVMARLYQFQKLTISHVTVENLPVVVLPMLDIENADGLLGMNFLREFDFKIDQQQSLMFIK